VVLQIGESLLRERLPKSFKQDVVLAMVLAYVDMSRDAMALDPPDFIRGREVLERALKLLQVLHCSCLVFCYNYDSRPILSFIGSISAYLSRINVFLLLLFYHQMLTLTHLIGFSIKYLFCACRRKVPVALHLIYKHRLMRHWKRLPLDLSSNFLHCPSVKNTEQEGRRVSKECGTHYGLLEEEEQHRLLEDLPGKIS